VITPESMQELQRLLLTKQPLGSANPITPDVGSITPVSPYEMQKINRRQFSRDPVIANMQKLGRGIKDFLVPKTPLETLSMIPAVKVAKIASKGTDLVNIGESLSDATQRLHKIMGNKGDKVSRDNYLKVRKIRDAQGHDVILKPGKKTKEIDTSYRMQHQARGLEPDAIRLDNLTKDISGNRAGYPSDFYTPKGQRIYSPGPRTANDEYGIANQQSYNMILKAKNKPNAEVVIYRAVPKNVKNINKGDFVTLSPKYAELHALSGYGRRGDEAGKVIKQKVKVKDLIWDANDVNEFGYFPVGKQ
jgi:hypothetical protein